MSVTRFERGPLLDRLITAQEESDAVASYPNIDRWARVLGSVAAELDDPLLLPVSGVAERLVGAALVATHGGVRVCALSETLDGERVLVVDAVAVSALSMLTAARHARALGASHVAGCAVHLYSSPALGEMDGYIDLAARALSPSIATAA